MNYFEYALIYALAGLAVALVVYLAKDAKGKKR